jgi:hypothetical protein
MIRTSNIRRNFYCSLFLIALGITFALAYGPHYGGVLPTLFGGTCGLTGCLFGKLLQKKRG